MGKGIKISTAKVVVSEKCSLTKEKNEGKIPVKILKLNLRGRLYLFFLFEKSARGKIKKKKEK